MTRENEATEKEEWERTLTPEQHHVMREKGTEPPFSGKYLDTKEKGMYRCAACGNPLFSSDAKYDSGTGWPSFFAPASEENVETEPDKSLGMERTEVTCAKCGAHLGHVFDDGPHALPDGRQASGKRYCINSVALELDEDAKS